MTTRSSVAEKEQAGGAKMIRILVVEDEPAMVSGLRDNFEFEGYEVISAADGVEGLERALKDSPDLVVLDVMMPRMSGLSRVASGCHVPCVRWHEPAPPIRWRWPSHAIAW